MKYGERIKASAGRLWPHRWYLLAALLLCSLLFLFGSPRRRRTPVIETITTREGSPSHTQPGPAVQFSPQLPRRDADIESAGDHLAAATVYLKNRQSAAALRALTQARFATAHAIDRRRGQGKRFEVLEEALRDIDSAERYVQRGAFGDARDRLASLNSRLDASLEY
jgi:hypothetical protein